MKVFYCKCAYDYGGGMILVAAHSKEEAFLLAATDKKKGYLFDWHNDEGWIEPDGNINHVSSDEYPFDKWKEAQHLSTDLTEPQVILEDHYCE